MKSADIQEKTKIWHLPHLAHLELLAASFVTQSFSRHSHERFAIGVIERGALGFAYRGATHVASTGDINLAYPGEVHNGYGASEAGWTYRMFYLNPCLLEQAAAEIVGRPKGMPFFSAGVIDDEHLAGLVRNLHFSLEKPETPILEQESKFINMLTHLVLRYADEPLPLRPVGREKQTIWKVREYIEAHYAEDISVNNLIGIANLSPFHLIRVFRN